jgi:hypothetical protein
MRKGVNPDEGQYPLEYQDVADAYPGNTDDLFMRFALATAATRAEARALRKALKLKTVAAEEMVKEPALKETYKKPEISMTDAQRGYIKRVCKNLGVNPLKLATMEQFGDGTYNDGTEIPHEIAVQMINQLGEWQNNKDSVPTSIKI